MSPIRGRAKRYCRRLRKVRQLANLASYLSNRAQSRTAKRELYFSGSVYYLDEALRCLAFASSIYSSDKLDQRSRYWTNLGSAAYLLNILESSNPGAYPWPVYAVNPRKPFLSLNQFLDVFTYRSDGTLVPDAFIWAWKTCRHAKASTNVRLAWNDISYPISPHDICTWIDQLLECHLINLYRRGLAWLVIFPKSFQTPALLPLFTNGAERIRGKHSRYLDNGRIMSQNRYDDCREWPSLPPCMREWTQLNDR